MTVANEGPRRLSRQGVLTTLPVDVRSRASLFLLAPTALVAILALWAINFGLPWLLRPDEDVLVGRAVGMATRGSLDPQFFNWPPLSFYLVAALEKGLSLAGANTLAGTTGDPTVVYLAARLFSALAVILAVAAITRAGARAFGTTGGVVAGVLLASAPLVVRQAHFGTPDALQLALVCAAIWLPIESPSARSYAAAGACCGLAAATKYLGGFAIVFVVARGLFEAEGRWRKPVTACATAGAAFAAVLLPNLDHVADYAHGLSFLQTRAKQLSGYASGWISHPLVSLPFGFGLGAYALGLVGLAAALRHRNSATVPLLFFLAAYSCAIAPTHEVFFRYTLPLLPALALLGGHAMTLLAWRPWTVAGTVCLVLAPSLFASIETDYLLSQTDTRRQAAEWLVRNFPPGTAIGEYSYFGQIFFDDARARNNPLRTLYRTGEPLIDGFQQGRFTDYFVIRADASVRVIEGQTPSQAPVLDPSVTVLARFQPYDGVPVQAVYEPDSFYLPYWGFARIKRPGPSIAIIRMPEPK